ncbi:hypothetical protein [Thiohalobacter sp.]|uniref:hypothetical protein n=1 Tax=Thiohalobacter sp. TaxID=2025948 RepID=UPI002637F202|nr:hypothetical protein [Thiohalobacter sp.]
MSPLFLPLLFMAGGASLMLALEAGLSLRLPRNRSEASSRALFGWYGLAVAGLCLLYAATLQLDAPLARQLLGQLTVSAGILALGIALWLGGALTGFRPVALLVLLSASWLVHLMAAAASPVPLFFSVPGTPEGLWPGRPMAATVWWYSLQTTFVLQLLLGLHAAVRWHRAGESTAAAVWTAGLAGLTGCAIHDLLALGGWSPAPFITPLGLAFLAAASRAALLLRRPADTGALAQPLGHWQAPAQLRRESAAGPADAEARLKAIEQWSNMGLRRIQRGATDGRKLAALFNQIRKEVAEARTPGATAANDRH